MDIYGRFIKSIERNIKTGYSIFKIADRDNKTVTCKGITLPISLNTPLKLQGRYLKDGTYKIDKIQLCGYDKQAVLKFLSDKEFNGIGNTRAEQILKHTGTDIFAYARSFVNTDDMLRDIASDNDTVNKALIRIKDMTETEAILLYITNLGGSYTNAIKLYRQFKDQTLVLVEANPYLLTYADLSITTIEAKAKKTGISTLDDKRIPAIVDYALHKNKEEGNTRITFHNLISAIHDNERSAGYFTDPLYIAAQLTESKYRVINEDGNTYVYFEKDYNTEQEIAGHIYRLTASASSKPFNESCIEETANELGIEYSKEQIKAFEILKTSGIKIITGGPGTGKTTFLNGCIKIYKKNNPETNIVLCAPTGCAGARMHDSTGLPATTIHRLLKLGIDKKSYYKEQIDADLIILDEVSMVGNELFKDFLAAVKNGTTVILVGDKNQLPSIDAGDVLNDLISSGLLETHQFEHIFRQNGLNSIVENANLVINGKTTLITDANFFIKRYSNENMLISNLSRMCNKTDSKYTVFTSARKSKFELGSIKLNRLICKAKKEKNEGITFGDYTFHIGDRVILNKNNYTKGYYNGEVGEITNIQTILGSTKVTIKTDDDVLFLEDSELNDIELGYAMTAHKAQGSECDNALIIVAKKPASMLRRRLLYVEITRAKKCVQIMSEGDALEKCITNIEETERSTGLKNQLNHNFTY